MKKVSKKYMSFNTKMKNNIMSTFYLIIKAKVCDNNLNVIIYKYVKRTKSEITAKLTYSEEHAKQNKLTTV